MRCRGSTPGSFERPSQRALSRQIAHCGGAASSARSAQPRARQPKMVTQQRIQALSSQRPAGSRGGNPHRDMGRRPGRRPVGGPPPGRLPYARTQKPAGTDPSPAPPSGPHPNPDTGRPAPTHEHAGPSLGSPAVPHPGHGPRERGRPPPPHDHACPPRTGPAAPTQGRGELRGPPPLARTRGRTPTPRAPGCFRMPQPLPPGPVPDPAPAPDARLPGPRPGQSNNIRTSGRHEGGAPRRDPAPRRRHQRCSTGTKSRSTTPV